MNDQSSRTCPKNSHIRETLSLSTDVDRCTDNVIFSFLFFLGLQIEFFGGGIKKKCGESKKIYIKNKMFRGEAKFFFLGGLKLKKRKKIIDKNNVWYALRPEVSRTPEVGVLNYHRPTSRWASQFYDWIDLGLIQWKQCHNLLSDGLIDFTAI